MILNADGAQDLKPGQFLVRSGDLVRGVAFRPTDAEIRSFMAARPMPQLPAPSWIDVEATRPIRVDDEASTMATEVEQLAKKIRRVWLTDGSKRAMAREAGVTYGGSWAAKIDQAIDYLEAQDATTPADSPPSGAGRGVAVE